jgi:ribonuclease Z
LHLYALDGVSKRLQAILENFDWGDWPNFYPMTFHSIDDAVGAQVIDNADFHIRAWRTQHMVPTIGLRIENKANGYIIAYSCDTEPCPNMQAIARNADLLIHEAAGATWGHSSAAQAGELGKAASVRKLALVHYLVPADRQALAREAQSTFGAPVDVAQDFDEYSV